MSRSNGIAASLALETLSIGRLAYSLRCGGAWDCRAKRAHGAAHSLHVESAG